MRRTLINDQIVNELAFDTLFHLSQPDKKDRLTARELRATKTARTARHFASKMTLDEKAILFAKIGISYSLIIHAQDWKLKDWYKKMKDATKGQQLQEASNIKLVVVNDRKVISHLNVMANLTHSDTYLLNMDFHRVGHFFNTWKDAVPEASSIAEALDYAKMINRFSLVHNMAMMGVSAIDLNILMYLYDCGAKYVTRASIDAYFAGLYKKTLISAALKRLVEKVLIERNPASRGPEYEITAVGTRSVMEFHTKNLNLV